MAVIERLRKFLDKGGYAGARLTNLPKKKGAFHHMETSKLICQDKSIDWFLYVGEH